MAKNLKFTIKNSQIAAAVNLSGLTDALHKKQEEPVAAQVEASSSPSPSRSSVKAKPEADQPKEQKPRVRARTRSAFSEGGSEAHEEAEDAPAVEQKRTAEAQEPFVAPEASESVGKASPLSVGEHALAPNQKAPRKAAKASLEPKEEEVVKSEPPAPLEVTQPGMSEMKAPVPPVVPASLGDVTPPATQPPIKHPEATKAAPGSTPSVAASRSQDATRAPVSPNHRSSTPSRSPARAPYAQSPFRQEPRSPSQPPRPRAPAGQSSSDSRSRAPQTENRDRPSPRPVQAHTERHALPPAAREPLGSRRDSSLFSAGRTPPPSVALAPAREKLGPTGKHVRDLIPPKPAPRPQTPPPRAAAAPSREGSSSASPRPAATTARPATTTTPRVGEEDNKKGAKIGGGRLKEFQDVKPVRKGPSRAFDARDRQGLRSTEEDSTWRKRRNKMGKHIDAPITVRPTSLHVRLPITVKDLAAEMKIKASQVIEKIFLQGLVRTINDFLDDPTLVELIGHELGCQLIIDTKEEDRIRITGQTVREEVQATDTEKLIVRPPIVAFMGHVDHGKTSLIDAIRKSNRVAGEAGAITQHIGAFQCTTAVGNLTILDTPGHEAFSAMRARGADVTDIVVLVVAGDEGIRQQTLEAIEHAKLAQVTIVVAINKCDKPNFNAETVYRQLSEHELLPEAWGGSILTINCSAVTGQGIPELLEMLALQSEVLELRADPNGRARGRVIESEMHKGMGSTATILVQNGTLRKGDSLVFDQHWGRVKTMRNDLGKALLEAGPSTPIEITGLSGLPEAGQEFIVVSSEREAREIAAKRMLGFQQTRLQQAKRVSLENLTEQAAESGRKMLYLVLRADMQGSLEALQSSLKKIHSKKVGIHVMSAGVGEISESDVQLAGMSKGVIIGFHTSVESHAESMIRQIGVQVHLHDIIYHAVDDVKLLMAGLLDRIAVETEKGKAEVLELFHSSQMGLITGCRITEGSIMRNYPIRLRRGKDLVWQGSLSSLKRGKEDVREVQKGIECGMVLPGCKDVQQGDIIEAYEITYITQEL